MKHSKEQGPLESKSPMLQDFKFKVQEGLLSGDKLEEALCSHSEERGKVAETAGTREVW